MTATTTATTAGGRSEGPSREILVLAGVVILGTIMTVLDLTIVNVAIPTLAGDLGASIPAIQCVMTGYMLAFATVIPLTALAVVPALLLPRPRQADDTSVNADSGAAVGGEQAKAA